MEFNLDSPLAIGNQIARLDGSNDLLWEPLWRIQVALKPVERALLTTPFIRRLHFLHHAGASYLCMPHSFSRLHHVLGVFALAAYFCPDDELLRVAALLHDVGHAPFSHTLEQLEGVDHHRWTAKHILSSPIAGILNHHGFDPQVVLACIDGQPANLLRNTDNILHLDHLDSWVRSAQASGILPLSPPEILVRLVVPAALVAPATLSTGELDAGFYLDMDAELADLLVQLIVAEARFHTAAANLGTNTILVHLVERALEVGALAIDTLPTMTDAMLEQILFATPSTAVEARRLWYRPHEIIVRKLSDDFIPEDAYIVSVDRLYLSMPLTDGRPVTEVSSQAANLVDGIRSLLAQYAVFWNDGQGN